MPRQVRQRAGMMALCNSFRGEYAEDGTLAAAYVNEPWVPRQKITRALLEEADSSWLQLTPHGVTFTVHNGAAVYRLHGEPGAEVFEMELQSSTYRPA